MYAGVSSELLLLDNKSISLGAEINYLEPREYRQLLGFRNIGVCPNLMDM